MKKLGKKKLVIVAIVLALIFGASRMLTSGKSLVSQVEVSGIEKGEIQSVVEVQGNVTSEDTAEITSTYNYEVIKINVKEGDTVKKGDVLAELDSKSLEDEIILLKNEIRYEEQRLRESYSALNNIYSSTQSLKLGLDNAKITLDNAQKTLEDKKALLDAGAIAKSEYDQAEMALVQAQNAYDSAQEQLKKGEHDIKTQVDQATPKQSTLISIESKKISLQQKQEQLEKLKITSPINGTVTRVYAKLGRSAQKNEDNKPMFIVEDESKKYITAKVGEYDISKIKLNQEVSISAEVLGNDKVSGIVDRISPTGEKSSSNNSIIVPVKILITGNDDRLITGVNAKAKIIIEKEENVYKVPFDSIITIDDKSYIFKVEDNIAKRIEVIKGLESDLETQITPSNNSVVLSDDMKIIKNPSDMIQDGDSVQVIEDMQ